MEHYGGPAAPPRPPKPGAAGARVHAAPRAAQQRAGAVSLERPRPADERALNAYVDAPVAAAGARRGAAPTPRPPRPSKPVTAQPTKGAAPAAAAADCDAADSILCPSCGRCRCAQCREPRALPSRWLCDRCLCSCETIIDYASCMCCVKACFYHCASERDGGDAPAANAGGGAFDERGWRRWACACALSPLLPCLCLYWPLRAVAAAAGLAYARASRRGCRCRRSLLAEESPNQ